MPKKTKQKKRKSITVELEFELTPEQFDLLCLASERSGKPVLQVMLESLPRSTYTTEG